MVKRTTKQSMSEDDIQIRCVQEVELFGRPDVIFFHVPNGGSRHKAEAAKFKRMGVKSGIPDLVFIVPTTFIDVKTGDEITVGVTHALELKTSKGKLSKDQKLTLATLEEGGAIVGVAYGLDNALAQMRAWGITGDKPNGIGRKRAERAQTREHRPEWFEGVARAD